eukprot:7413593-Ditylum_brightwellii.AAC.2
MVTTRNYLMYPTTTSAGQETPRLASICALPQCKMTISVASIGKQTSCGKSNMIEITASLVTHIDSFHANLSR